MLGIISWDYFLVLIENSLEKWRTLRWLLKAPLLQFKQVKDENLKEGGAAKIESNVQNCPSSLPAKHMLYTLISDLEKGWSDTV